MTTKRKTKGQLEAELSSLFSQFVRVNLNRGPKETKVYIVNDVVLVRLKMLLAPAEEYAAQTIEGATILKKASTYIIEIFEDEIKKMVGDCVCSPVVSMYTDFSFNRYERIFVFVMEKNIECAKT